MIHAEANCLSLFRKNEARMIAVTLLPCRYCATTIASYGIKKVVYGEVYEKDLEAEKIFEFYDIELVYL
jgi:dCMP deaminase